MLGRKTNCISQYFKCETFLPKLFDILNNKKYRNIIYWNNSGNGIIIFDINSLSKIILPQFYKHHNFSSFVRQLNMYGFYKNREILNLSYQEYLHDKFNINCTKEQIKNITRKKSQTKSVNDFHLNDNKMLGLEESQNDILNYLNFQIEENSKKQNKLKNEIEELKLQNKYLNNKIIDYKNYRLIQNKLFKKFKILLILLMLVGFKKKKFSIQKIKMNDGEEGILDKNINFINFVYKYLDHIKTHILASSAVSIVSDYKVLKNDSFCINNKSQKKLIDEDYDYIKKKFWGQNNNDDLSLLNCQFGHCPNLSLFKNDSSSLLSHNFFKSNNDSLSE